MLERTSVLTSREQLQAISESSDLFSYQRLHRTYLEESEKYLKRIEDEAGWPKQEPNEEHYKLLGLVSTLVNQAGFETQFGHLSRHVRNNWAKPIIDVRHQLAMASYLGKINTQAYAIRRDWVEQLREYDPHIDPVGIWGTFVAVSKGRVIENPNKSTEYLLQKAKFRATYRTPICLPNVDLNCALMDLNFTGDDAENMSDEEFMEEIYPRATAALNGIIDTKLVFDKK